MHILAVASLLITTLLDMALISPTVVSATALSLLVTSLGWVVTWSPFVFSVRHRRLFRSMLMSDIKMSYNQSRRFDHHRLLRKGSHFRRYHGPSDGYPDHMRDGILRNIRHNWKASFPGGLTCALLNYSVVEKLYHKCHISEQHPGKKVISMCIRMT